MAKGPSLWKKLLGVAPTWFVKFASFMNKKRIKQFTLLFTAPVAFFLQLTGKESVGAILSDPVDFVRQAAIAIITNDVIAPFAQTVFGIGVTIIDALLLVFFGANGSIGTEGGQIGLLDIPLLPVEIAGPLVTEFAASSLFALRSLNRGIASLAEPLGIAAAPVVFTLYFIQVAAGLWISWRIIQSVDIAAVDIGGIIRTVLQPLAKVWGVVTSG